jgi:hypothetical protein
MIKIVRAVPLEGFLIRLEFSDHSTGDYDAGPLVARDTVMVRPLRDPEIFRRCFLELGALCWPNGFELSPSSIFLQLREAGKLHERHEVA